MGWISPDGHVDPNANWSEETKAYDEDIETYSFNDYGTFGYYLELTLIAPISCSKIQIMAREYLDEAYINPHVSIDVYYSGGWHNIFEGVITKDTWVEKEIGSTQTVSAARVKSTEGQQLQIWEFYFWEVEIVTHERTFTDGLKVGDALVKMPIKAFSDSITLSDVLVKNPIKTLVDGIALSDVLEKVYIYVRSFTDGIAIADTLVKSVSKVLTDGIKFTDVLTRWRLLSPVRILKAIRNLASKREEPPP